jgi:hypothetical protein
MYQAATLQRLARCEAVAAALRCEVKGMRGDVAGLCTRVSSLDGPNTVVSTGSECSAEANKKDLGPTVMHVVVRADLAPVLGWPVGAVMAQVGHCCLQKSDLWNSRDEPTSFTNLYAASHID